MISTGTGVAPFASLMREPETYEKFDQVYLTQTCRKVSELAYGAALAKALPDDPLVGEFSQRFIRFATTTREPSPQMGRITDLIDAGALFRQLDCAALDPDRDRVMICGSMALNQDVKALLETRGFTEGSNARPGDFVVERAFVG
jgi:ferredoxin--NADP+ reductase